nr:uncharacterized protein si:ch211-171b20.3 isoform X2 [Gasterosteus aculeatus aculeatus]
MHGSEQRFRGARFHGDVETDAPTAGSSVALPLGEDVSSVTITHKNHGPHIPPVTFHGANMYINSGTTTLRVDAPLPASEERPSDTRRGPGACGVGWLAHGHLGVGAGGQPALGQNNHMRRKLPAIQPPSSVRLERTRTVIPQLSRNYHMHRPGSLHPFGLSKELSHSHSGQPFTLGYPKRYELNATPAILFPSTLVLNGRNTFTEENCKRSSRPKLNYPTGCNLRSAKDHRQKSQSYPDPVVGAPRSFIHRVSELSNLEGETVRQEKLKKKGKPKKTPS